MDAAVMPNATYMAGITRDTSEIGESSPRRQEFPNRWDFRESVREDIALIVHKESQQLALSITKEIEKLHNILSSIAKHPLLQVLELDHVDTVPHSSKHARTPHPTTLTHPSTLASNIQARLHKHSSETPSRIYTEHPKAPPENHCQLEIAHLVSPRTVFRDFELEVEEAFQGAEGGNADQVHRFLDAHGDPNVKVAVFKGRKKTFTDCNLLPISAIGGNVGVVRLLMEARANVDGTYTFAAGSLHMPWTGTAADAAVVRGNMEMMKEIVKRKADVHRLSSNKANLVWQASYVGHRQILDYLLQHEVSHEIPAQSQDLAGISFTPLHIATVQGHTPIVESLLDAKANFRRKNEQGHSPLVDAILCGRTTQIRLLISHGASILDTVSADSMTLSHKVSPRQRETNQVFDSLIAERNPVLVHAAALGLNDQEQQVESLSTEHVLQFIREGDSDAVIAILKAVFRRRNVVYRGEHQERVALKTASMPRAVHLKHTHVVESAYRFADIAKLFSERKRPDQSLDVFFKSLCPSTKPRADFRHYRRTSVCVYESLVQDFHFDIRVVYAIARLSSFDPILETKQCSAIIGANWNSHTSNFCGLLFVQIVWVLALFAISVLLQETCSCTATCQYDERKHYPLRVISGSLIPLVMFEAVLELTAFSVFASYSWLKDYVRNPNTYASVAFIVSHFWVLSNILFWGDQRSYYNKMVLATCCLLNWVYLLYVLTPLRLVGIQVIPILYAIFELAPFIGVMFFFLAGFVNGYLALHFGDLYVFDAFTEIVDFALIEKLPRFVDPPYPPIVSDGQQERLTLVLVLVSTFLLPIILMNTLIAAVCNSYTTGIENIERLYQSRRAKVVFVLMARSKLFRSVSRIVCKNHGGTYFESPHRTLWYIVEAKRAD